MLEKWGGGRNEGLRKVSLDCDFLRSILSKTFEVQTLKTHFANLYNISHNYTSYIGSGEI